MMKNAIPVSVLARMCIVVLLLVVPAARGADDMPAPVPAPARPAASAIDAARDYTDKLKSPQPLEAIRAYWDIDAMLSGMFGDHLARHTEAERTQMKTLLLGFLERVYADPKIAEAMRAATFDDFKSNEGQPRGLTTVTFNLRLQDVVIRNALQMKENDGQWRIHDAGSNGRMMVPALKAQYDPQAQRTTPLDYMKAMVAQMPGEKKI